MVKTSNLTNSVQATMNAFEAKVKKLEMSPGVEDKLAALKAHINKQVEIPLDYIRIEDNVRRTIDTTSPKFKELVESIKKQGLLQNLVVDLRLEDGLHSLFCIAGQRRLLAAKEAGKTKANCLIKQFDNVGDRLASGLAENLTREDLHCVDIAEGFAGLIENGWSEQDIADQFERNPRTIRRYLSIAQWPKEALQMIRENQETFTTKLIFNDLISHKYESPSDLLSAISAKIAPKQTQRASATANGKSEIKKIIKSLSQETKYKIALSGNQNEGVIRITYKTANDFQRLIESLRNSSLANESGEITEQAN